MDYVSQACQMTRGELPAGVPLIGFCGSPFTLACYMVDGCGSDFWHARHMMHARPDLFRRIVEVNARAVSNSLVAQARAGCEAVMIFDSWGGLLDRRSYELFSLAPIRRIVAAVQRFTKAPVIVFCAGLRAVFVGHRVVAVRLCGGGLAHDLVGGAAADPGAGFAAGQFGSGGAGGGHGDGEKGGAGGFKRARLGTGAHF